MALHEIAKEESNLQIIKFIILYKRFKDQKKKKTVLSLEGPIDANMFTFA